MPISFIPYTAVYGPLSIPGVTCALWLDAADTTTLTFSGPNVTQWRDKSPSRNNSTSCSATTSSINGNTVLTNPVISGPITNSGSSVVNFFIVGTLAATGGLYDSMLALNAATITNYYAAGTLFACYYGSTNPPQFYSYMNGNLSLSSTGAVNTPFIFNAFQSGTTGTTFFNGNPSGAVGTAGNTFTYTNYYIGTCTGGPAWVGNIAEIIVFNNILSTPQQQAIEGYLAQKWGTTSSLPPGHPGLSQTYYNGKVYQPQISLKPAPYANYFPLSIGGCALWLDGADPLGTGTPPANGATLSTWSDKSGLVNHFSLTSGTPASITDGAYRVVSIPSGAIMTSANQISFTTSSAFFIVSKLLTINPISANINMLLGFTNINPYGIPGDFSIRFYQGLLQGTPTPGNPGIGNLADMGTGNYYVNGSFNPNFDSTYYMNSYSIIDTVAPIQAGTSYLTISSAVNSRPFIGNVAEFIYFPGGLTTNQRQQIEGYLAWKWGLQASLINTHPYYSASPLQYTRGAILGAPIKTGISFVQSNYIAMTLTGSSAGAVTNYQIPITVYRTTGTNSGSSVYLGTAIYSDYSNLYFLASNQVTQLSFYIESSTVTATSAVIWVSVPSIPASPSTIKVYLYWYLSGTYTSSQNGTSTFLLFDEFTGAASSAPNSSIWTLNVKGSGGTGTLTGSGTIQLSPTNSTISSVSILSVNTLPANNFCIHVRRQFSGIQYTDITFAQTNSVQDLDAGGQSSWWHTTLAQGYLVEKQNISGQDHLMIKGATGTAGSDLASGFGSTPVNTWELIDFTYTSSGLLNWSVNGSSQASATNTTYLSGAKYLLISQGMYSLTSGYVTTLDYVFVRNYVNPEPSVTAWGALNTP